MAGVWVGKDSAIFKELVSGSLAMLQWIYEWIYGHIGNTNWTWLCFFFFIFFSSSFSSPSSLGWWQWWRCGPWRIEKWVCSGFTLWNFQITNKSIMKILLVGIWITGIRMDVPLKILTLISKCYIYTTSGYVTESFIGPKSPYYRHTCTFMFIITLLSSTYYRSNLDFNQ